jgi:class 3 adenylate cyclase
MNESLLKEKINKIQYLEKVETKTFTYILNWLLNSEPIERFQINPYNLITVDHSLNLILPIFLHGVIKEAFTLNWQMHCPHCNMVTDSFHSLRETKSLSNCKMCEKDYTPDFKDRVEVTFSLTKDIEDLELPAFCTPPPSLFPLIEFVLPKGSSSENTLELPEGEYRYFCPITLSKGILYVNGNSSDTQEIEVNQLEGEFDKKEIHIQSGKVHFVAKNPTAPIAGLFLHKNVLNDEIPISSLKPRLNGLTLQHFPLFSKLFGAEVLSGRERLLISSVTLLFTDITASTKMYETLGDIKAYNIVRDHFDILLNEIQSKNGIIVKTIGDAVMASFPKNSNAFESIFSASKKMKEYNLAKEIPEKVFLKIGVHRGSAILVNLNDRLDYFGSTVNKAARIQSISKTEQISISEEVFLDKEVQSILKANGINRVSKSSHNFKGLEGMYSIYQFKL